ncbi:tRNA guanosine(15) transglycosylase TgtA [Candidatus Bathyarchaeota archaeon]|nr:tRNA guanosine(15) transglycosylase TgtA [Candidatus Bathyarchaeota archaeon]
MLMSFELRDRDLLGRIGKLRTKSGEVETPAFMPVINPVLQTLEPRRMKEEFGIDIVITNSYIIKNHFEDIPALTVHSLLDYDGVIMTDSGAYQILVYGGVKVNQPEIIAFQKRIESDIAVILDIPTGWDESRSRVEYTVNETLERAKKALPLIEDTPNLWVGPVQGGRHLDLVADSARRIGEMPYDIHALGSPTEVMERYMYPVLVDMTMMTKLNIPVERPLHLFGAGHPMVFALAVAMGCDLFDSAAYVLYAKDDRYLTNQGTLLLENLQYLPCNCPICRKYSASELKDLPRGMRQEAIAEHNLHVTATEMEIVKQAIVEGRLWDLVETRAKAHPQMSAALKTLSKYSRYIEKGSSGFKGHGVFYYDYNSLVRPETLRHNIQLKENFKQPEGKDVLVLIKAPPKMPFNRYREFRRIKNSVKDAESITFCFYAAPYGIIPEHLSETFPLSQYDIAEPLDIETIEFTVENIREYLESTEWRRVILVREYDELDVATEEMLMNLALLPEVIQSRNIWEEETGKELKTVL